MSTLSRLLRLTPKTLNGNRLGMLQAVRPVVTIKVEPAKSQPHVDHDERNALLKRPMSPHLAIYSFQAQMFVSISHRIAGGAMALYLISFGLGSLALPQDISTYIAAVDALNLPAPVIFTGKYLLALPFTFHAVNGLRHLVWDSGKLLYIKQVLTSGYFVIGAAVLLAIGLASG